MNKLITEIRFLIAYLIIFLCFRSVLWVIPKDSQEGQIILKTIRFWAAELTKAMRPFRNLKKVAPEIVPIIHWALPWYGETLCGQFWESEYTSSGTSINCPECRRLFKEQNPPRRA